MADHTRGITIRSQVKLQVAHASTNTGWIDVPGLFELKLTRSGNSQAASLEATVAAVESLDSSTVKRFYPFLNIRVIESDPIGTGQDNMPFIGRIDQATPIEDDQRGRCWSIRARDFLAVLADNYIDRGKWADAALVLPASNLNEGGSNLNRTAWGAVFNPLSPHDVNDDYVPNYVGDYENFGDDTNPGEHRKIMIMDLALNIVNRVNDIGIASISLASAPNSKKIEINLDQQSNTLILDAIRSLADSDPWSTDSNLGAEVSAKDIAASESELSGFGGEFQMAYHLPDVHTGRDAQYYKRGVTITHAVYVYGETIFALIGVPVSITAHSFGKEGGDIFSRVRTTGRGESDYRRAAEGGGTGVAISDLENKWDPEKGQFMVRRDYPTRFDGDVGDWTREDLPNENDAIRARGLRDRAYAKLLSGGASLKSFRGGDNRGTITIPGIPRASGTLYALPPGDVVQVVIDPDGINDLFTVETWTYTFPDDSSVVTVARHAFTDLSQQLVQDRKKGNDSSSAHNNQYDTTWLPVGSQLIIKHNLGVKARSIKVSAAKWTGDTILDFRIPKRNTEVEVPPTHYEASQGQNMGFGILESTPYSLTLVFAHWLAYSEGMGAWLTNDDANALVRVVLTP